MARTRTLFGEHLKREREMRGVTLEEISAATRISIRFLEALEKERWDQLPGGIFNRGFIRTVARFLGLNEESLIAEYALETHDRPQVAVWANTPRQPSRARLATLLVLLIAALVAGGWEAYRRHTPLVASWRALEMYVKAFAMSRPASSPASPAPASAPAQPPDAGSAPAGLDLLELKIEAGKPARVKVIVDGKEVFSGALEPGETKRFLGQNSFEVSSNESSAVLLELNGQLMPPLGPTGQSGGVKLTRRDLKKTQGGRD